MIYDIADVHEIADLRNSLCTSILQFRVVLKKIAVCYAFKELRYAYVQ